MGKIPNSVVVADLEVDLSGLSVAQKEYFLDLKKKIIDIYEQSGQTRAMISFAGQSGAGKSVTCEILKTLINEDEIELVAYRCGLDAFHYPNAYLEKKGLKKVKGRFDTYDLRYLNQVLTRFHYGHNVACPTYSRVTHEPNEEGFMVSESKALLLMEGLWFLRDEPEWNEIREHFIYNFLVTGDEELTKKNTIDRHMRGGRPEDDAVAHYENSDHKNTVEILNNRVEPDEIILYYAEVG